MRKLADDLTEAAEGLRGAASAMWWSDARDRLRGACSKTAVAAAQVETMAYGKRR